MIDNERLASSFCQFAMRLQSRVAIEPLNDEEQTILCAVIKATIDALDDGEVCLDLARLKTGFETMSVEALLVKSGLGAYEMTPNALFVIDEAHRVYLQRFYDYEVRVATRLKALLSEPMRLAVDRDFLEKHFPNYHDVKPFHEQALAVAVAQMSPLTVISGGPGTGKTWTVVKILEALLCHEPQLRIAMCAPTGKAAARMSESVRQALVNVDPNCRERIPVLAQTVHRLKKEGAPLPYDVIVLDEASMVSLSLLADLIAVLPSKCRLICLGDKDQLASVEPGAVFAELSARFGFSSQVNAALKALGFDLPNASPIQSSTLNRWNLIDHTVWLTKSRRFDDQKGIGLLARSIRENRPHEALAQLSSPDDQVCWLRMGAQDVTLPDAVKSKVLEIYETYFEHVFAHQQGKGTIEAIFCQLRRNGVLCAQNEGAFGVETLNRWVAQHHGEGLGQGVDDHFVGEIVMVSVNDYDLNLNNGDVGVVLKEKDGLSAYFESVDTSGQVQYRSIPVGRLPAYKRAFALTIHKSQGSEYDRVLVVMPPQSILLTRELFYTAVTRAKTALTIVASAEAMVRAIQSPTQRISGLMMR